MVWEQREEKRERGHDKELCGFHLEFDAKHLAKVTKTQSPKSGWQFPADLVNRIHFHGKLNGVPSRVTIPRLNRTEIFERHYFTPAIALFPCTSFAFF
jgi:hypothetical protein